MVLASAATALTVAGGEAGHATCASATTVADLPSGERSCLRLLYAPQL